MYIQKKKQQTIIIIIWTLVKYCENISNQTKLLKKNNTYNNNNKIQHTTIEWLQNKWQKQKQI